jgi:hypothetical protein
MMIPVLVEVIRNNPYSTSMHISFPPDFPFPVWEFPLDPYKPINQNDNG